MKSVSKFHPVKWHIWVSGDIIREYHQCDNAAFLADDNISASSFLSSYPAITSKQAHKLTGQYKGQYIWGMDGSIWGRAEKKSFILRPRILSAYEGCIKKKGLLWGQLPSGPSPSASWPTYYPDVPSPAGKPLSSWASQGYKANHKPDGGHMKAEVLFL